MTPYEAGLVFEHLRDTGIIEAAGEIFGRGACKGLIAEAEAREKLDKAASIMADALEVARRANISLYGSVPADSTAGQQLALYEKALRAAGRLP